jgi:hypothetical protein
MRDAAFQDMRSRKLDVFLLISAVVVSRFVFRSHYLYDLDSVNFALGMERFDPRVHQAHPPGYFLYICLGRLLNVLCHNANLALVVLSILASCGVVVVVYYMALDWFDQRAARFAGILFLISPLGWFHGIVALTYSVEAFFSALLGYLCWRVFRGNSRYVVPAAIALGISAGVRPSSVLFLGPIFLFSLTKVKLKGIFVGMLVLALTLAAWFLPMIAASGGFKAYFGALISLWQAVPSKGTVFNSSPVASIDRAITIIFIYFLTFGLTALVPLRWTRHSAPVDREKKIFTFVWIAPALCFFTFIFLKFVNSGYLLLLAPAGCIWLGISMSEWYENSAHPKAFKLVLIGLCAAVNTGIFVASPLYCSYMSVRRFEGELRAVLNALPKVAPASSTLIVGFDSHFLGYRDPGYYLPDYLTLQCPEVKLREGTRVFAMQGGDTHLISELPSASYSQFVIFPLPNHGGEFKDYMKKVLSPFPSGHLRTVSEAGHDFVIGPISDLPLLFSSTASGQKSGK